MVTAIPVSASVSVINGKTRYTNNNIKASATNENVLAFAGALNSLQYLNPADRYEKTVKYELIEI